MWRYVYTDELHHHGILGMKWGVRRFETKGGHLTPSGKKRYDDVEPTTSKPNKSGHRLKLEEKYRQSGMSEKEAELAAEKRIKTEKIVAVVGGLTVAAAAAYVVNKNIQEKSDRIIKSGKSLQRIAREDAVNMDHALYTSWKNGDNMKYRGWYGRQLLGEGSDSVKKVSLVAKSDIKVASRDKAANSFVSLYKNDPQFKLLFDEHIYAADRGGAKNDLRYRKVYTKLKVGMSEKDLKKYGYDAFNRQLAGHDEHTNAMAKKFYDSLRTQGYDAITDINDNRYSGFKTKAPTIVFNAKNTLSVRKVEKLTTDQIMKDAKKTTIANVSPQLAKAGMLYIGTPIIAAKTIDSFTDNESEKK